jgi:hypothetical protein
MASSYGVIKNNVQNFLKNTQNYGYSIIDNPVEFMEKNFMEKNFHDVPGIFCELITFGNVKHMVHNGEVIFGVFVDSKHNDENSLGVFSFVIYDEKIYVSDRMNAKSFNPAMRKFNGVFKAYCGFSSKKAFEYFVECFACVNDKDQDIKEIIVNNICEEVTDLLNEYHDNHVEYLNAKQILTDTNAEVHRRVRESEEQQIVNDLQARLAAAKENLNRKRNQIIEEENLNLLKAKSQILKYQSENLLSYYHDTIKHHIKSKPIPNGLANNIESTFLRMLDKVKIKAVDASKENKSGD